MGALLKYLLLGLVILWLFYSPAVRGRLKGGLRGMSREADARRNAQGGTGDASGRPPQAPVDQPADRIVPCAHCGVHLPLAEALHDIGGRVYCSEAHRLAGPRV